MRRTLAWILAALLALGATSCSDLLSPGCGGCPGDAHWESTAVGWIAPVYDTYCVSTSGGAVRLLDECCCDGKALSAAAAAAAPADRGVLTARYE